MGALDLGRGGAREDVENDALAWVGALDLGRGPREDVENDALGLGRGPGPG